MKTTAYITTSWDDGHPLDLRVAELLAKYGLRGTFYVPKTSEYGTMSVAQVQELSRDFEIGGHTMHHVDLSRVSDQQAWQEIADSRSWVEECTGRACPMFCPPRGRFSARHLEMIRRAGYLGVRTVELLSIDLPHHKAGLVVVPTTVQAYPHGLLAYARNTVKRLALGNLWRHLCHCRSSDWTKVARFLLNEVLQRGGVFHLWGHSWELEKHSKWRQLEEVLCFLGETASQAPALTNGQVCQAVGQGSQPDKPCCRAEALGWKA